MSITSSGGDLRPFPVRFDPTQRERLDLLAQLTGRSATDIVREGTVRLLDALSASPEIRARVDDHVAQIRKEADARQAAVNAMFGIGVPEAESGLDGTAADLDDPDGEVSDDDQDDPQLDLTDTAGSDAPNDAEERTVGGTATGDADADGSTQSTPAKKTTSSRRSSRTSGK